jgi:nitroimidazol reductase NimA-like FMN-containing flavoprotein (pyridoxamine 5'-phosphate oxidase superfamily)
MYSNDGFRELDRHECMRLLATASVGRIVFTRQALPAVLLSSFRVDGEGAVLVRTSAASELARAVDGAIVAFEADVVDESTHSGWSVVITGRAALVTGPVEQRRPGRTDPRSSSPATEVVFVRIEPELVAGRDLGGGRTVDGVHMPV